MTQSEAIRAFRRTWKPRAPRPVERSRPRPVLVPACAHVDTQATRACRVTALPPPAECLRHLLTDPGARAPVTGVRRRPEPPSLLGAAHQEQMPILFADPSRSVPPPLPATSDKRRNSRDPTDPHVTILTVYEVPPVPASLRARRATLPAAPHFIELRVDDSCVELIEPPVRKPPPIPREVNFVDHVVRLLRMAWLPRAFGFSRR